jgi:hypothetical protein
MSAWQEFGLMAGLACIVWYLQTISYRLQRLNDRMETLLDIQKQRR